MQPRDGSRLEEEDGGDEGGGEDEDEEIAPWNVRIVRAPLGIATSFIVQPLQM